MHTVQGHTTTFNLKVEAFKYATQNWSASRVGSTWNVNVSAPAWSPRSCSKSRETPSFPTGREPAQGEPGILTTLCFLSYFPLKCSGENWEAPKTFCFLLLLFVKLRAMEEWSWNLGGALEWNRIVKPFEHPCITPAGYSFWYCPEIKTSLKIKL